LLLCCPRSHSKSWIAAASNPREAAAAQAQATYNSLLRQGVDTQLAGAVAAQQQANANEQIYQSVQKMVNASKDQLDLTRAQGTEYEKVVRAQIASQNALDAGATSEQAGAIRPLICSKSWRGLTRSRSHCSSSKISFS